MQKNKNKNKKATGKPVAFDVSMLVCL